MEKPSTNNLAPSSLKRTLSIFIVGGFFLYVTEFTVSLICNVIWVDFIHYNPHRTLSDSLTMIACSPIIGLFFTLMSSELTLIIGAIGVIFSHWIWKRLPLYSLLIIIPLCIYATHIQLDAFPEFYNDSPSSPISSSPFDNFVKICMFQLPVSIGCWWWSHRT